VSRLSSKDVLKPPTSDGVKLTLKKDGKDQKIQAKLLEILAEKGVVPVIDTTSPTLEFIQNEDTIFSVLTEQRLFNYEACEMDDRNPIDYTQPHCAPFAFLAIVALNRGINPSLGMLRVAINKLQEIQQLCKGRTTPVANQLLTGPMQELAKTAGIRFNMLTFASVERGLCEVRKEMLMQWLEYIKRRVMENIVTLEKKMRHEKLVKMVPQLLPPSMNTIQEGNQTGGNLAESDDDE
jgi:hypothetical protein